MAHCVPGSLASLPWTSLLLMIILIVTALFLVQSLAYYRMDQCRGGNSPETYTKPVRRFGRVAFAMLTPFRCATGGIDWAETYDLVADAGPITFMLFMPLLLSFFAVKG